MTPTRRLISTIGSRLAPCELADGTYRLAAALGDDETFRPALLPGLVIPLAELWR